MSKKLPPSGPTPQGFVCPAVPPYILEGKKCPIPNWNCQFSLPPPPEEGSKNVEKEEKPNEPPKKVVKAPPIEKISAQKTPLGWVVPTDPPYIDFGIRCPVPGYDGRQPETDAIFEAGYKPIYPHEYIEVPPKEIVPQNLPPKDPHKMILIPMQPSYIPPQPKNPNTNNQNNNPNNAPNPPVDHSKPYPGPPPTMVIDPPDPRFGEAGPC